jgi:hypothetical protein
LAEECSQLIAVEMLITDVLNGWVQSYLSVSQASPDTNRKRCGPMQPAWIIIFMMVYVRTFSIDLDGGGAIVAHASVLQNEYAYPNARFAETLSAPEISLI